MDALGPRAEEGRGKATKSLGLGRLAGLAGDARMGKPIPGHTGIPRLVGGVSGRTETSQYPEEKKSTEILLVVANERGRAQTQQA